MYKIFVYNWFTGERIDWLVKAFDISCKIKLNDSSSLEFYMDLQDEQANNVNLKPYNIVRLYRYFEESKQWKTIFAGYIENRKTEDKKIRLSCPSMETFFAHRRTQATFDPNGNIGSEMLSLLTYTNSEGFTPVTAGINEITKTIASGEQTFSREKIIDTWRKLIKSIPYDLWIDPETLKLNLGVLGSDKSSVVGFQSNWRLPETTNLEKYSILDDANKLTSRLFGKSGDLESIQEQAIADYPLLETVKSYSEAKTQEKLDELSEAELDTFNSLQSIPEITPAKERELFENYWIGDWVRVKLVQNAISLEKVQRIVAISVTIGYNNDESISIETSDGDSRRQDLVDVLVSHEQRLETLENNL